MTKKLTWLKKLSSIKPIILFSIITGILALFLLISVHFQLPDFYTNRQAAFDAAQIANSHETTQALMKFENIRYKIFNPIFQIFSLIAALLCFSAIFKVDTLNNLLQNKIFRNKTFIYCWINLTYIPYAIMWVNQYMNEIEQYEYNAMADSMGIPFFNSILSMAAIALWYYPIANFLVYITYNTKICRKFYTFLLIMGMLYYANIFIDVFQMKFSYWTFGLYFYLITSFALIYNAIGVLKEKRNRLPEKIVTPTSFTNKI